MKTVIATLVTVLVMMASALAAINQQCPQHTVNGTPQYQAQPGDQELCKLNYAVIHRCSAKAPVAVFERLTAAGMNGQARRRDDFRPDPAVTESCRASLADYATVGRTHGRGHMSPAANNSQTDQIMSESFYLSNMLAQVANNNRGAWRLLEAAVRQWASQPGTDFYVISGGIFDAGHPVTGNGLGIPTRLYKIVIERNSRQVQAYLFPNTAITPATSWPQYQTTMTEIERATGMRFNLGP